MIDYSEDLEISRMDDQEIDANMSNELLVICLNPDCTYMGEMPFDGMCPECGEIIG